MTMKVRINICRDPVVAPEGADLAVDREAEASVADRVEADLEEALAGADLEGDLPVDRVMEALGFSRALASGAVITVTVAAVALAAFWGSCLRPCS